MPDHLTPENVADFLKATGFNSTEEEKVDALRRLLGQPLPRGSRDLLNQILAGELPDETIEYRKVA